MTRHGLRKVGAAHQITIALARSSSPLIEGPDNETLTTAAITGGKNARKAGGEFPVLGFDVGAGITLDVKGIEERLFRAQKTHGEKDELRRENFLRSRDLLGAKIAFVILLPLDIDDVDGFDVAVFIAFKVRCGGEIDARIVTKFGSGFFLTVIHFVGFWPFGPWIARSAAERWLGHDLELRDGGAAMAQGSANAISAGITATNDDDVFAFGVDGGLSAIKHGFGVRGEEVHRHMDAFQFATRDGEITRLGGPGTKDGGVELLEQLVGWQIFADGGVAHEFHAFIFKQPDAPQNDLVLVELHVRNAIHEQSAGAVRAFEHRDGVSSLVELGGSAQSSRAGTDDGDLFPGAFSRSLGSYPTFLPTFINDRDFDVLDGDRRPADADGAGTLAWSGTDTTRKLGEVVGLVQTLKSFFPQTAIDQIIPFRDEVVDRTTAGHAADERAGMAKRNTAVHAPRTLFLELCLGQVVMYFLPVAKTRDRIAVGRKFALVIDEAGWFSHDVLRYE